MNSLKFIDDIFNDPKYYTEPILKDGNIEKILFSGANYRQICSFVDKKLEINWLTPTYAQIKIDNNLILNKGQYLIKENNEFKIGE